VTDFLEYWVYSVTRITKYWVDFV